MLRKCEFGGVEWWGNGDAAFLLKRAHQPPAKEVNLDKQPCFPYNVGHRSEQLNREAIMPEQQHTIFFIEMAS
jgi:hypothetical protein